MMITLWSLKYLLCFKVYSLPLVQQNWIHKCGQKNKPWSTKVLFIPWLGIKFFGLLLMMEELVKFKQYETLFGSNCNWYKIHSNGERNKKLRSCSLSQFFYQFLSPIYCQQKHSFMGKWNLYSIHDILKTACKITDENWKKSLMWVYLFPIFSTYFKVSPKDLLSSTAIFKII